MLFLGSPKKMIHDEAGGCSEQLEELSKRQMEADLGEGGWGDVGSGEATKTDVEWLNV